MTWWAGWSLSGLALLRYDYTTDGEPLVGKAERKRDCKYARGFKGLGRSHGVR